MNQALELGKKLIGVVQAVAGAVADAGARAEEIQNLSDAYNATTDEVQALGLAIESTGGNADGLGMALGNLAEVADDARQGGTKFGDALASIGLRVQDVRNMRPAELLEAIAEAASKTGDANQRAAALSAIFGARVARNLTPALLKGADGLRELAEQGKRSGYIMDKRTLAVLGAIDDAGDRASASLIGLKQRAIAGLAPAFLEVAERAERWYDANQDTINLRLDWTFTKIGDALTWVADAASAADTVVTGTFGSWQGAAELLLGTLIAVKAVEFWPGFAAGAAKAWKYVSTLAVVPWVTAILGDLVAGTLTAETFFGAIAIGATEAGAALAAAAVAAAPWVLLVGVVAGVALVIQDLIVYARGGKSAIGDFLSEFGEGDGVLDAFARVLKSIGHLVSRIGELAAPVWDSVSSALGRAWDALAPLREAFGDLASWAASEWAASLIDTLDQVAETIEWIVKLLTDPQGAITDALNAGVAGMAEGLGFAADGSSWSPTTAIEHAASGSQVGRAAIHAIRGAEVGTGGSSPAPSNTTNREGDTYNVDARGMDKREAEALVRSLSREQNRGAIGRAVGSEY